MQTGGWTSTRTNMGTNADEYNDEDEDTHIDMDEAMEGGARHTRQTHGWVDMDGTMGRRRTQRLANDTWAGPWYEYEYDADEDEDEDTHT